LVQVPAMLAPEVHALPEPMQVPVPATQQPPLSHTPPTQHACPSPPHATHWSRIRSQTALGASILRFPGLARDLPCPRTHTHTEKGSPLPASADVPALISRGTSRGSGWIGGGTSSCSEQLAFGVRAAGRGRLLPGAGKVDKVEGRAVPREGAREAPPERSSARTEVPAVPWEARAVPVAPAPPEACAAGRAAAPPGSARRAAAPAKCAARRARARRVAAAWAKCASRLVHPVPTWVLRAPQGAAARAVVRVRSAVAETRAPLAASRARTAPALRAARRARCAAHATPAPLG